jgi:protein arginine N-methyltransferase 5
LNLEVAYANFCGVRSIIIPGPRSDENGEGIDRYARAIQEALVQATRANIIIHIPMYREPGLDEKVELLSSVVGVYKADKTSSNDVDIFSAWDSWHTIRSVCNYNSRLYVGKLVKDISFHITMLTSVYIGLRLPLRLPEMEVQDRWFAEPLHYLTFGPNTFQENRAGHPCLGRLHQEMINRYMRLKNAPWMILYDVGPDAASLKDTRDSMAVEFPSLSEAHQTLKENRTSHLPPTNPHVSYMRYVERHQPPYSALESVTMTSFQDWLQSPLQPLSDNLESATYEVFEGDPVKYYQYELAITEAMYEWKKLGKPTSSIPSESHAEPELVVAVAGAGRGPLVTRVIRAAEKTQTAIQLWALEKNPNAYVYLLRQNKLQWGGKVTVVKTDMRGWEGPKAKGHDNVITTVDILVTELLGSFGDNELSPECLDGIQRHIAKPHGISIPHSYTAHLSPIATPRIYADISSRIVADPNAFETPWVVRLFAINFVSQTVPHHDRFQQAWEFVHPVEISRADDFAAKRGLASKFVTGGGGSMYGSGGTNEHNTRHCHLTFVCPSRGVIHGLAGYFESVLYASQLEGEEDNKVEISILPEQIDLKSKDMISWFPIFFPLKVSPAATDSSHASLTSFNSNRYTSLRTPSWK